MRESLWQCELHLIPLTEHYRLSLTQLPTLHRQETPADLFLLFPILAFLWSLLKKIEAARREIMSVLMLVIDIVPEYLDISFE